MSGLFSKTKGLVEGAIAHLGIDPASVRVKEATNEARANWTVRRGSARVLIALLQQESEVYLRIISPLMVPAAGNRDKLYTRLLEMNADGLLNCAFGLVGEEVVVVSERPALGLDENEIDQMIRHLSAVADTFDDRLIAEFGGKRCSDT